MIGRERGRGPLGRGGRGSDEIAESAARMRNDLKNRFSNKIQTFITIIYVITKYLVSCLSDAWSDDVDTVTCEWLSQPRHCQTAGLHTQAGLYEDTTTTRKLKSQMGHNFLFSMVFCQNRPKINC